MKYTLITIIIVLWSIPAASYGQYLYTPPKPDQLDNLYYTVASTLATAPTDSAITNLTQTLRSYGPPNSHYITEERVRKMVFDGSPNELAILLMEIRRKAAMGATRAANQAAMFMNHADQGAVFQEIRELDMSLRAPAEAPPLTAPRTPNTQQSWDTHIQRGTLLTLFTNEELHNAQNFVQDLYQQELALSTMATELTLEHRYTTLFENGSLEDSFYDLIVDVNRLDEIWYGPNARSFEAPWFNPGTLPDGYRDPRITTESAPALTGVLTVPGLAHNVFIPFTNQTKEFLTQDPSSAVQPTDTPEFYQVPPESRSFMPFAAAHNSQPLIPANHEQQCMMDGRFCLQVDINILQYPLFGNGDFSILQQLTELRSELSTMSQKNLATKAAGKNIFEIGITPGIDLGAMLDMNVITSTKPMTQEPNTPTAEERLQKEATRLRDQLLPCANSGVENAVLLRDGDQLTELARQLGEAEANRQECAAAVAAQPLGTYQDLRGEAHRNSMDQFVVLTSLLRNISAELAEMQRQTVFIQEKPKK